MSLGLFSSNDVDSGTRLLLKTLAKETDLSSFISIADIGCGVGTIGLALKAYNPGASLLMRDRDALAAAFTSWNASLNKLDVAVETGLFLEGLGDQRFDLIATNIPAKAGDEVMEDFFLRSPNFLTDKGVVAMVIVSPLRERAEEMMISCGLTVLYREHTKMHSVYHFTRRERRGVEEGLLPYVRYRGDFELEGRGYELDTVYNLPDFDGIGWRLHVAAAALKGQNKSGTWCFWNPGQGHLPVYLKAKSSPGAEKIILTGRDLLQLRISKHNLEKNGWGGAIEMIPLPVLEDLMPLGESSSMDLLCLDLGKPIPRTDWVSPAKKTAEALLKKGGLLVLFGKSSDIHQFDKSGHRGFSPQDDIKFKGNRALVLRKND